MKLGAILSRIEPPRRAFRVRRSWLPEAVVFWTAATLVLAARAASGGSAPPVLQRFEIPLDDFRAGNAAFDPGALASVRFVFDPSRPGRVALDDVGLR